MSKDVSVVLANDNLPSEDVVIGRVTEFNAVQPLKIDSGNESQSFGIVMDYNDVQSLNMDLPLVDIGSGIVTSVNKTQPSKA